MTDTVILSTAQKRKIILGKIFCIQHDLFDLIFKDSFDNNFNNFINLYERSLNYSPKETVLFEVKTEFREKTFLQWNHGNKGADGIPLGMRFPGFISYMKTPTKEKEPHKIIDIDLKNMINFIDPKFLAEYEELVRSIEYANINSKLISEKDVSRMHDLVDYIGNTISDEMNKYSWVGGVFWGGKGFSYWGDWSHDLVKGLSDAGLVDSDTNIGESGYHAQRLCSTQLFKPTLVTNYLCGSGIETFKYCCPAFFMVKNDVLYPMLEKYYKMSFITTFKSTIPIDKQLKWQDGGSLDLNLWEAWRLELKKMEDEIKIVLFSESIRK